MIDIFAPRSCKTYQLQFPIMEEEHTEPPTLGGTKPLPYDDSFASPEEFVESLLSFTSSSDTFQMFCGGVHILDFYVNDPGLFHSLLPKEWQGFLLGCDEMLLLNILLRFNLDEPWPGKESNPPPASLVEYIQQVRSHTLNREFNPKGQKLPALPRNISLGMKPKKIHEVANFAGYCDRLADEVFSRSGHHISHFVDLGSGRNYLGRTLASEPYNRSIVAVEGKEGNVNSARVLDALAGLAEKEVVMRNNKVYKQMIDSQKPINALSPKSMRKLVQGKDLPSADSVDVRPLKELKITYRAEEGKGFVRYIQGRVDNGDLTGVVDKLKDELRNERGSLEVADPLGLMAVSIHSCGNLTHYGIRSLIMNPDVKAVAVVGCCYNLATEKLGPPPTRSTYMRQTLQAKNRRLVSEEERRDPQGYPLSERVSTYAGTGIRLNITARMMACQAPLNWTEDDSEAFFTRHFYRAVLQKILLDRGAVSKVIHKPVDSDESEVVAETPFNMSTNPIVIGSLRKRCYDSFHAYVRGALAKLTSNSEYEQYKDVIQSKIGDITDEEISGYIEQYRPRQKELNAMWSLIAFSACVVEALIVTDRWLFLKEHPETVQSCWVETVFDYKESPRNLVVVGVKR